MIIFKAFEDFEHFHNKFQNFPGYVQTLCYPTKILKYHKVSEPNQ